MVDEKKLFVLAKAGKIEAIFKLVGVAADGGDEDEDEDDPGDTGEADDLAYKWLQVAADFGHEEAEEAADDMLETSSLRYDDGQMVQGLIHLELGEQYLAGKGPLPVDFEHARRHLGIARELKVDKTTDVAKGFDATRRKLGAEARAVFDGVFPTVKRGKAETETKAKTKAKAKTESKIKKRR